MKTALNGSNVSTGSLSHLPPPRPKWAENTSKMTTSKTANIFTLSPASKVDANTPTSKDLMLFIVLMRRNIRRAVALLERQNDIASSYRRRARKLREYACPFDGARIAELEAAANDVTVNCEPMRETLKQCGQLLSSVAPMIDTGTTLAQRCEILNVNVADRASLTEADGINHLLFAHRLEDSASRRNRNDGPLYQALQQVFINFLINTKEGQKLGDSLFQPDGLLAGVPMYTRASDGSMKRLLPRLSVVASVQ